MIYAAKPYDVLIEPRFRKDKTASGLLFLPETSRERCTQGIVKYIGSKVQDVKVGDRVAFSGYSGTLAKIGNEILIIMPEKEIDFKFDLEDPDYGIFIEEEITPEEFNKHADKVSGIAGINAETAAMVLSYCWEVIPIKKATYPEMMKYISDRMKEMPETILKSAEQERDREWKRDQTKVGISYA